MVPANALRIIELVRRGIFHAQKSSLGKKTENACRPIVVCWLLDAQQQASVIQGRIYSDNFTCCHTEI